MTLHYRAEGRHEYTTLVSSQVPDRLTSSTLSERSHQALRQACLHNGRGRGIAALSSFCSRTCGLSRPTAQRLAREIQDSPILTAITKGVTSRVLGDLEKLAEKEPESFTKIWDNFGAVLKEGIYDDFERRDTLLALSRFKTTASAGSWRSLKDYVAALKENRPRLLPGR